VTISPMSYAATGGQRLYKGYTPITPMLPISRSSSFSLTPRLSWRSHLPISACQAKTYQLVKRTLNKTTHRD
jgi:hypothetical protein